MIFHEELENTTLNEFMITASKKSFYFGHLLYWTLMSFQTLESSA